MAQVCTIASCMRQRDAGTGSLISFLPSPLPPTFFSFKRQSEEYFQVKKRVSVAEFFSMEIAKTYNIKDVVPTRKGSGSTRFLPFSYQGSPKQKSRIFFHRTPAPWEAHIAICLTARICSIYAPSRRALV